MSEDLLHHKQVKENGDIVEIRITKVPKSNKHPEGLDYSLVYIRNGKRLIGYDNFEGHVKYGSSHHRHIRERIMHYDFIDEWKLIDDFTEDLEKIERGVIK